MIEVLSALVVLAGAVAVAALVLALVALRRLRALQHQWGLMAMVDDLPMPGEPVPEFVADTVGGGQVGTADLAGEDVLVLFLDGSCPSCFDAVPMLRERPPSSGPRPLAVVIGQPAERAPMVAELATLARVVEEDTHGGLAARFGVRGFPAALVVGGGQVRMASHQLDQIELGVAV